MKEIVKLVTSWDIFETEHPNATIEDFCRYYLIKKREAEKNEDAFGGHLPPEINARLSKLFGRLTAINIFYFKMALKNEKYIDIESFTLINAIHFRKESRKTDVISENFMEASTGIDILNRLKNNKLINERDDPTDKRAKLVKLTAKGNEVLYKCWEQLGRIAFFMYNDLDEDDKKIVFQLLCSIDTKHAKIITENKGKEVEEIIQNNTDRKKYEAYKKFIQEIRIKHKK